MPPVPPQYVQGQTADGTATLSLAPEEMDVRYYTTGATTKEAIAPVATVQDSRASGPTNTELSVDLLKGLVQFLVDGL